MMLLWVVPFFWCLETAHTLKIISNTNNYSAKILTEVVIQRASTCYLVVVAPGKGGEQEVGDNPALTTVLRYDASIRK